MYADDVLRQGIQGISDLIVTPSLINLDFADVRSIMKNTGLAHMGIGHAKGENKTIEAVRQAVSSPLLETTIEGATGVILNVKGGLDLPLDEVYEAANLVREVVDPSCNIIFGAGIDEGMNDEVEIPIIATGFQNKLTGQEKDLSKVKKDVEAANNFAEHSRYEGFPTTKRLFPREEEQPKPQPQHVEQPKAEFRKNVDGTESSRLHVDDAYVPPFLRKYRNNK